MRNGLNGRHGLWKQISTTLRARARLRRQHASKARTQRRKYVSEEQLDYADTLDIGVRIGRYILLTTFVLYISGVAGPKVPLFEMPVFWSMSSATYLYTTDIGKGWGWVDYVEYGDYLNFVGICILAGLTIVSYLRILPGLLRTGERTTASILIAEVLVLALAASGLLTVGH